MEVDMSDTSQLVTYSQNDAGIAEIRDKFMGLTIAGVNDREGYKRIHEARIVVKTARVDIEKRRKELKADALEYGRKVDSEAKRLTGLLEPIESHLQTEEDRIDAEKEAIRNAARLKAEAEARAAREAEKAALRAAQEQVAEERRKLEAEKSAIEAERRKIEEEARRQAEAKAAEERKIREAEDAKRRAAEFEQAKAEAAERAKRETEERMRREAEAKAAAKLQAEKEAARRWALLPDREKLLTVPELVRKVQVPTVSSDASTVAIEIMDLLNTTADRIWDLVNRRLPAPVKSGDLF